MKKKCFLPLLVALPFIFMTAFRWLHADVTADFWTKFYEYVK